MTKRVLVGMSGGVDSSVVALLLKQQGYEVIGATMCMRKASQTESGEEGCGLGNDIADARRVCEALGIEHLVFDATEEFSKNVVECFVWEYQNGRTPNPCVLCNRRVKFEEMLKKARELGCDAIATGHYAHIRQDLQTGRWRLYRSPVAKDQSYMLYALTQEQLAHTLFPLGNLEKDQVRKLAQEYALPVAHKADSQEICFIPDHDYAAFIERHTGKKSPPGPFLDKNGTVIGTHRGVVHYTIGQRKGLGAAFGKPMYVTKINPQENTVTLGEEGSQYSSELFAGEMNWIAFEFPQTRFEAQVKVRYQAVPSPATVIPQENGQVQIRFETPQRSVTPGQAVVLYQGDLVLGGGTIQSGKG